MNYLVKIFFFKRPGNTVFQTARHHIFIDREINKGSGMKGDATGFVYKEYLDIPGDSSTFEMGESRAILNR